MKNIHIIITATALYGLALIAAPAADTHLAPKTAGKQPTVTAGKVSSDQVMWWRKDTSPTTAA